MLMLMALLILLMLLSKLILQRIYPPPCHAQRELCVDVDIVDIAHNPPNTMVRLPRTLCKS